MRKKYIYCVTFQKTVNSKDTIPYMSHVMCHMSRDMCHMSRVTCLMSRVKFHVSLFFLIIYLFIFYKGVKLVCIGSVINGAYLPFCFYTISRCNPDSAACPWPGLMTGGCGNDPAGSRHHCYCPTLELWPVIIKPHLRRTLHLAGHPKATKLPANGLAKNYVGFAKNIFWGSRCQKTSGHLRGVVKYWLKII